MIQTEIIQTDKAEYIIRHREKPDVVLNFSPIISKYNLEGEYCLIHWRAKPKGLTNWGVYDSSDDSYTSFKREYFGMQLVTMSLLGIDNPSAIPNEVVFIRGRTVQTPSSIRIKRSKGHGR